MSDQPDDGEWIRPLEFRARFYRVPRRTSSGVPESPEVARQPFVDYINAAVRAHSAELGVPLAVLAPDLARADALLDRCGGNVPGGSGCSCDPDF